MGNGRGGGGNAQKNKCQYHTSSHSSLPGATLTTTFSITYFSNLFHPVLLPFTPTFTNTLFRLSYSLQLQLGHSTLLSLISTFPFEFPVKGDPEVDLPTPPNRVPSLSLNSALLSPLNLELIPWTFLLGVVGWRMNVCPCSYPSQLTVTDSRKGPNKQI